MRIRNLISTALALTFALAACGSDGEDAAPGETAASSDATVTTVTVDPGGRGWLDGSPDEADERWRGDVGAGDDLGTFAESDIAAEAPASTPAPTDGAIVTEGQTGPPRAGSIDDNEAWDEYLAWRDELIGLGVDRRTFDVDGRVIVTVRDGDGRPVVDRPVDVLADGEVVATLRTRAGGRLLVHPAVWGVEGRALSVRVLDGGETVVEAGGSVELAAIDAAVAPEVVDLHVVLDVTGSMGDEIAQLREAVDAIAVGVEALPGRPALRLGMTVYRDEGDAFVTRTFDLTDDVSAFRSALDEIEAEGGGDEPEALDEALDAALTQPAWTTGRPALRLALVIADAPPQVDRQLERPYTASLRTAAELGVKIHTIAASGTDDVAEFAFREMAAVTDGRFVFLSYGSGETATGAGSDVGERDWEELPLDQLVVRLVAEDLAASAIGAGGHEQPEPDPVPTTSSTTIPAPGQG